MERFNGKIELAQVNSTSSYEREDKGTGDLPNVLTILLDDVGFAQLGCYGSSIETPNINSLADDGLRYNNFHTTAICSATRASLLTGANHHTVGVCTVTDNCTGEYPNQKGYTDFHYANIAEVLHEYGYTNYMVGKWHLAPSSDITEAGPFTHWPLGRGFDQFYGFLEGYTDQYHPNLVSGNTRVDVPKSVEEGYHLTEDLVDHAIDYINKFQTIHPDRPFYMHLALGAGHSPHQVPKEYIEKYRGKFSEGWDVLREKYFLRQKELGIIPQNAKLSDRNQYVKPWEELSEKERVVYQRYMEVFAGFLEHTDAHIGRLLDYLEKIGKKDNTLILFMSDNGASAEGGKQGLFNQDKMTNFSLDRDEIELAYQHLDEMGTEYSNINYPVGWANLGNTPFQWYKTFVHSGGVKDPLIVRYPALIDNRGGIRQQYHHVTDIAPTILDVLGIKKPETIKGIAQYDYHGISMKYTFSSKEEPTRKQIQYYEMIGNRGIWKDGWKLVCNHMYKNDYESDDWELYHTDEDYSEVENLIDVYPKKAEELLNWWYLEAGKYHVLPLGYGSFLSGDKKIIEDAAKSHPFLLEEQFFLYKNIKNPVDVPTATIFRGRNHVISIELGRTGDEEGVLYAAGHRFGGYILYIKNNRLYYTYNCHRETYTTIHSSELPIGKNHFKLQFRMQQDQTARVSLVVNGRIEQEVVITEFIILMVARAGIKASVTSSIVDELPFPFAYPGWIDQLTIQAAPFIVNKKEYLEELFAID